MGRRDIPIIAPCPKLPGSSTKMSGLISEATGKNMLVWRKDLPVETKLQKTGQMLSIKLQTLAQ